MTVKLTGVEERELVFDDGLRVEIPDEATVYANGQMLYIELPRTKRRKLIPFGSDENFVASALAEFAPAE